MCIVNMLCTLPAAKPIVNQACASTVYTVNGSACTSLQLLWYAGMNKITDDQMAQAEKQIKLWESMINSMTPKERETPELLAKSPSRRRRIARGSGRKDLDVSNMIGQFTAARSMVQNMSKMMKMQGAKGQQLPMQLAAP